MKFSMKNLNPGAWFYFDKNDPESGKICIRILSPGKLSEIRNSIETEVEFKDGQRYEYQKPDTDGIRDKIIWDYCIVDWQNLVDDDNQPIECNIENKLKLMQEHIGFSSFVENCLTQLNEQNEIYKEYSEKN